MLDDHVARRHGDSRTLFNIKTLENTVVDDRGVTLRPEAQAETRAIQFEAHRLGEVACAVRQHRDVGCTLRLLPCIHDPRVVDADACDGLNAFCLQLVEALHETREVNFRAAGRERTGNGKEYDFALAESVERADGLGHAVIAENMNLDVGDLVSW